MTNSETSENDRTMQAGEYRLTVSADGAGGKRRFASLQEAVEAAREQGGPDTPRRIVVGAGTHFVRTPVLLDERDSGLVIAGDPAGGAVLCGGRRIGGWRPEGDRFWTADVPEARDGGWMFRALAVNGMWRDRARRPEEGCFLHRNEVDAAAPWQREIADEYADYTTLKCDPADIGPDFDAANAEVRVYHAWDESLADVAACDPATSTLTLRQPCIYPPGTFSRREYIVWNTRDGMTQPGRWYLDRTAGKVVYWPLPDEDMASAEVVAPALESIVRICGKPGSPVRDVMLRDLALVSTKSRLTNEKLLETPSGERTFPGGNRAEGAVTLRHAEGCALVGLSLARIGGRAVRGRNAPKTRIVGCDFADIGCDAVLLSDSPGADIADNSILRVGRLSPGANAVRIHHCDHVSLRHNEIGYAPYNGIGLGRSAFASICSNRIHHVMQEITDGAGIYIAYGVHPIVKSNHVSDLEISRRYKRNLRHAYYFDVGCRHGLLEGNAAERCRSFSHVHMADQITIRNNAFISDEGGEVSFRRSADCVFERNVLQAKEDVVVHDPGFQIIRKNVLFSQKGRFVAVSTHEPDKDEIPLRIEPDNVFADPAVREDSKGRFRAMADRVADALDIAPVNVATAGPKAQFSPQHFTFEEEVREAGRRILPMLLEGMKRSRG